MYRLVIEMEDKTSLSAESAVESLKPVFGENALIKAFPLNNSAKAHLDYAISEMLVHDILEAYYELWPHLYEEKAEKIKENLLHRIKEHVDNVEREILHRLE